MRTIYKMLHLRLKCNTNFLYLTLCMNKSRIYKQQITVMIACILWSGVGRETKGGGQSRRDFTTYFYILIFSRLKGTN